MIVTHGLYKIGLRYVAEYEAQWDEALRMDVAFEYRAKAQRIMDLGQIIFHAQNELRSLLAS